MVMARGGALGCPSVGCQYTVCSALHTIHDHLPPNARCFDQRWPPSGMQLTIAFVSMVSSPSLQRAIAPPWLVRSAREVADRTEECDAAIYTR